MKYAILCVKIFLSSSRKQNYGCSKIHDQYKRDLLDFYPIDLDRVKKWETFKCILNLDLVKFGLSELFHRMVFSLWLRSMLQNNVTCYTVQTNEIVCCSVSFSKDNIQVTWLVYSTILVNSGRFRTPFIYG